MIIEEVRKVLEEACRQVYGLAPGEIGRYNLSPPPASVKGDVASNIAFVIPSVPGIDSTRAKVAEALVNKLMGFAAAGGIKIPFRDVTIAGNSFINFNIKPSRLHDALKEIIDIGQDFGFPDMEGKDDEKVIIEFVSANPTGPLHIGHGRGAVIGDCIARVMRRAGKDVTREYYVNDVGNQVQILGASVLARKKELSGEEVEFPQNGYKGDYIRGLASELDGFPSVDETGNWAAGRILEEIKRDLKDFGVEFDTWFHESDLHGKGKIEGILGVLRKEGYVEEKDGALWFRSSSHEGEAFFRDDKDRVLKRSDGRPTYFASDMAYHYEKLKRGYRNIIDIWGADHHGYVARMQIFMEILEKIENVSIKKALRTYQLVNLRRGKEKISMSTRGGEFVTLRSVMDEVGRDAARFFLLMRGLNSPLEFDLELAKEESSDNPVYYVQYSHARISSLLRESQKRGIDPYKEAPLSPLTGQEELDLIKKMAIEYPSLIENCINSGAVHLITVYLLDLAKRFHGYYERHRILDGSNLELTHARLLLARAVKSVIKSGLELLGVNAPEKM